MLKWLDWLVAPVSGSAQHRRSPSPVDSVAEPSSSAPHATQTLSSLARSSAFINPPSPSTTTSKPARRSISVSVKKELSPTPIEYSSSTPSTSMPPSTPRLLEREDTEPDLAATDASFVSMGITIPSLYANHVSCGITDDRVHGWRPMTEAEERRIHQEQLAKLLRDRERRRRASVELPQALAATRKRRAVDVSSRNAPTEHARAGGGLAIDPPSCPSSALPIVNNRSSVTMNPWVESRHSSGTQTEPKVSSVAVHSVVAEEASHSRTTVASFPPVAIAVTSHPSAASGSRRKVAENMEKVVDAKKKARHRISGGGPMNPNNPLMFCTSKKRWISKRTGLRSEASKLQCLAQEEAAIRTLGEIYARREAKEAAECLAEEARRLAEEQEAREKETTRKLVRHLAQTTWQYQFVDKLDEEETKAAEIHVYREGLLTEFWRYDEKWKLLKKSVEDDGNEWTYGQLPWPIQSSEAQTLFGPAEISSHNIYNFMLHPLRPGRDIINPATRQDILREERLNWDPEQCMKLLVPKVVEAERAIVMDGVKHVFGLVCAMLKSEEDLFEAV